MLECIDRGFLCSSQFIVTFRSQPDIIDRAFCLKSPSRASVAGDGQNLRSSGPLVQTKSLILVLSVKLAR